MCVLKQLHHGADNMEQEDHPRLGHGLEPRHEEEHLDGDRGPEQRVIAMNRP
jgi:hypothetical protein